jgi:agmatinase
MLAFCPNHLIQVVVSDQEAKFDPSGTGSSHCGLFGVPTALEKSRIVIIPVPWEVTTSYGGGTSLGPQAILEASPQIDLFDLDLGNAYQKGYHLLPIPKELQETNARLKPRALAIREELEQTGKLSKAQSSSLKEINEACAEMSAWVHGQSKAALKRGQIPAVLGGDHSTPEGNIQAVSEHYKGEIGILHIDAHADLREHYQGFERSHASIMNNVMSAAWKPAKLVQVGIRDFSEDEYNMSRQRADIHTFFDAQLKARSFAGESWGAICKDILKQLPNQVYISFDIDGLDPRFCPGTGTPVPGGLEFDQATYLVRMLAESGRKIVGFDLNEVSPIEGDEWDGNVGARMLYKLCGWTVLSNQ